MSRKLIIGTRGSVLALCQAGLIKEEIESAFPDLEVRLKKIKTTGDKITDVPLALVGGKGLFVKEIEEALYRNEIDMAVHSMKDMPSVLPEGLHLAAITRREDPRDIVVSRTGKRLLDLPRGARIGTSSLRRQSQIRHLRPDFEIVPLRGNLDTRINKLGGEGLEAVVLAAAGVRRLGWEDRITEYLDPDVCLPAIGQGALGLECRDSDGEVNPMLARFNHPVTSRCVRAERALLKRLEGGCQVPIAGLAQIRRQGSYQASPGADASQASGSAGDWPGRGGIGSEGSRPPHSESPGGIGGATAPHGPPDSIGERLVLEGLVASIDGTQLIRDGVAGDPELPEVLGLELAERLLSQGADAILREIYQ